MQNTSEFFLSDELKTSIRAWLPTVIEVARLAGETILQIYQTDFQITNKEDDTPVTCADLAANELIVKRLSELTPEVPILSEESAEISYAERSKWETYWLVDPLDGTKAFIERTGEFSVNIALVHQHQPIIGVICSPVKQCCYYACYENGAFSLTQGEQAKLLQVRSSCPDKIVVAGTKSSCSYELQFFLDNLVSRFEDYEIIYMGSSLKSCMVAEGIADVYVRLGPTSEWDTAAAQCIVEEAGGQVTDINMQPLKYNTKESLLNPKFFVFGDHTIAWNQFLAKKS